MKDPSVPFFKVLGSPREGMDIVFDGVRRSEGNVFGRVIGLREEFLGPRNGQI